MRPRVTHDKAPPGMRFCPKCTQFKPMGDFVGAYCRTCNREYVRKYKKENRGDEYARLKREALEAYGTSCADCGEADPEVLTFWPPSSKGIVHMLRDLRMGEYPQGVTVVCLNCRHKRELRFVRGEDSDE